MTSNRRCTGISASWCPVHGDCVCGEGDVDLNDPACPLHSPTSTHGSLTAVVELPAAMAAAGLVFLTVDDWERLVAAMRAAGVDPAAVGDVQVHRVAPRVGGDSPVDDTP